MHPAGPRGPRRTARHSGPGRGLESRSFRRGTSVWAHRRVRAAAEACHARAGELARRRLEVPAFDPLDGRHDNRPAALEVFRRKHLLAVFLEAGGPAHAEEFLSSSAPDPAFWVPDRIEVA